MERTVLGQLAVCCTLLALQLCLASVTVKVTPKVEVIKGENVKLPCSYTISEPTSQIVVLWHIETSSGRKQIAYKTNKDSGVDAGTPLTDRLTIGDDFSLTISPVMVEDERSFFCQVSGGPLGVSEAETQVKVFYAPEKPVITGNNQAITVSHDTTTSSEVGKCTSRNAHPQPRIIWFKDNTPLPEVKDQNEKTYMILGVVKEASGLYTVTSSLFMQPVKADAESEFHCTVEYSMPNNLIKQDSSDKFKLSLLYSTENVFFKLLNQGPIKEGDEVKMECKTDGNPQPKFDFYKEEKVLKGSEGNLTLNVTREDAGTYKCEAQDFDALPEVELIRTLSFKVHYLDPVVVAPEGPLLASQGDVVELQCKTKSSDEYTLQWKKNSKVLSQTGVLTLQSVSLADAGVYVCVGAVPSVPGLQKQASVNLTVSGKPEIDDPVNGLVAKEGGMVTLNCSALGYPAPQFTWTPSGKVSVTVVGNKVISTVTLATTAAVLKDGVTCEASNKHGIDSKKFKVSLKSDPATDAVDNTANRGNPVFKTAEKQQGGSSAVVIAVVVCVLLLLVLVALLFFLNKKGKLNCEKKDKKDVASGEVKGDIVVEMTTNDKGNEDSNLLKKPPTE
ncbi:basal cell adhesion molecule-like isoform X1 [Myxocyprinus asiaticus]|uniref:basal cell adhesion molecule-like isoform X1 n=1 Tax=Myxocyprinus asiaticus TaxID=70543 RepID=UPI002221A83B|nr:basal cell adhesion molecule-like isoform X1 [Myxocyprinus asiaticus]XP_051573816.1 basal cell adhesion molecule-like isoform X1 [Myxocyprinus asiaticus]